MKGEPVAYPGRPDGGGLVMIHSPVMVSEVLQYLIHENSKNILDATIGTGGHAAAILERCSSVRLVGLDRDPTSLRLARDRLSRFGDRVKLVQGVFADLGHALAGIGRVDGVLADLGVSSAQLDSPARGFSYQADGPLDMRMGTEGVPAADWVERSGVDEIASVLRRYGEVRQAKRLARAIKQAAGQGKLRTTALLKSVVADTLGAGATPSEMSRVFQAFRIQANSEMEQLDELLTGVLDHANPKARIVVIAYHSLEDRAVKAWLKLESASCICPPGIPVCACGHLPRIRVLTKRVVRPSPTEVSSNSRARSARLRAAEALSPGVRT
jgi:16S rRNA (cytosine1402-N4)-methyltransferase